MQILYSESCADVVSKNLVRSTLEKRVLSKLEKKKQQRYVTQNAQSGIRNWCLDHHVGGVRGGETI